VAISNWIELAALLLILAVGIILWRVCKRKLNREGSVEGIITERGKRPWRHPMDVEEEIRQLQAELGEK